MDDLKGVLTMSTCAPDVVADDAALQSIEIKLARATEALETSTRNIRHFLKTHMTTENGRIVFRAETAKERARLAKMLRILEDKRDTQQRLWHEAHAERSEIRSRRPR
jgi:hypothetical protein